MKTFFTFLVGLAFAWSVSGQDTLYIYQSGGQINKLATAAIDSIIFYRPAETEVIDIDGNIYETIRIGTQTWMATNLKVTKYRNGNAIGTSSPVEKDITEEVTPKYQWAYEGNESNVAVYGRLYTWFAVTDSRGLCPTGWHVPTTDEWTILTNYLGGEDVAGGKLKEEGLVHWVTPNTGADNSSGFTALPAGYREYYGDFNDIYHHASWWTATSYNTDGAYYRMLNYDVATVNNNNPNTKEGHSVRCLKD